MPAKKKITSKTSVSTKQAVAKKVVAKSKVAKKTPPKSATPSLISAVPMSTISPKKPEQVLYESDVIADEPKTESPVAAEAPKRGRGRPRKTEAVQTPLTNAVPPTAVNTSAERQRPIEQQPVAAAPAAPVAHPQAQAKPRKPRRGLRINRRLLIVLTIFIVLVAGGWYWYATHAGDSATADAKLVRQIAEHVVLPKGETPTMSTVVDETKVNQEFLKNAKKGDKVLLYFQSSQAIVYRPSTGQVVNMGPLQTPRPRVFIRQGSNANNVAAVRNLVSSSAQFLVASQDQSPTKTYDKTIVVDLTGNRPDLAGQLAQLLRVNVGNLPAGELPPDADLMVIVGSDFK